jgi:hyaluronan/proteoglycan link protein 3
LIFLSFAVPVVHVTDLRGGYKIPNLAAAATECVSRGMRLASHAQLEDAWKLGLDVCACGWLADGSVAYPTVRPRNGCRAGDAAGIRTCPKNPSGIGWDAYCTDAESKNRQLCSQLHLIFLLHQGIIESLTN